MNAGDAVTNQTVSVCRLSSERRSMIIKAMFIAIHAGEQWMRADERNRNVMIEEINNLLKDLQESDEIWLVRPERKESKWRTESK